MLKKVFLLLVIGTSIVIGKNLPPVPGIGSQIAKKKALMECKVPPQIAILPPQIDRDYRDCVNAYYKPDFQSAEMNLQNIGLISSEDNLISVTEAKGFIRAYEFIYETREKSGFFLKSSKKTKKTILCDDSMHNCYRVFDSVKIK
ncbi:MAG: hypothetical protein OIF32_05805 [Campylobacterales bacterium]|nr:hypothetical protein [Campylobacterales bacterium]